MQIFQTSSDVLYKKLYVHMFFALYFNPPSVAIAALLIAGKCFALQFYRLMTVQSIFVTPIAQKWENKKFRHKNLINKHTRIYIYNFEIYLNVHLYVLTS